MRTLTVEREVGKRTGDDKIKAQVDYLVKRGLTGARGKGWKLVQAKAATPVQRDGKWVFSYELQFEKVSGHKGDVENRQWKEISDMIAEVGAGTKWAGYPWKIVTPAKPVPVVEKPPAPKPEVPATFVPPVPAPPEPMTTATKPEPKPELKPEPKAVKKLTPRQARNKLKKLIQRTSTSDIIGALLDVMPWEQLISQLGGMCLQKSYLAKNKSKSKGGGKKLAAFWYGRGRLLYRSLNEQTLKKVRGDVFKVVHRDIYFCKCGHHFPVDIIREKNIALDMGQMEWIVTCPQCNRHEDISKAKKAFKEMQ
jgi:hypothetical protein